MLGLRRAFSPLCMRSRVRGFPNSLFLSEAGFLPLLATFFFFDRRTKFLRCSSFPTPWLSALLFLSHQYYRQEELRLSRPKNPEDIALPLFPLGLWNPFLFPLLARTRTLFSLPLRWGRISPRSGPSFPVFIFLSEGVRDERFFSFPPLASGSTSHYSTSPCSLFFPISSRWLRPSLPGRRDLSSPLESSVGTFIRTPFFFPLCPGSDRQDRWLFSFPLISFLGLVLLSDSNYFLVSFFRSLFFSSPNAWIFLLFSLWGS